MSEGVAVSRPPGTSGGPSAAEGPDQSRSQEQSPASASGQGDLRDEVAERLADLDPSLRLLARDWLAEESRIDLLACDGQGRATLVLVGQEGEDPELFTRALALRAWAAARIGDWLQLAPDLGLRPEAPARAWLVCPRFQAETRSAAAALGPAAPELAVAHRGPSDRGGLWLEVLRPAAGAGLGAAEIRRAAAVGPARFRSGLSEADLNLSVRERREFD